MVNIILFISLSFALWSCQDKNNPKPVAIPPAEQKTIVLPVAHIFSLLPTVQQRPTQTTSWREAFVQMPLQNKDEIRTAKEGFAFIKFVSGKSSLSIAEKSFVVIWDRDEEMKKIHVIALPEGEIKGLIASDSNEKLEIRTPGGWIQAMNDPKKKREVEFKISSRKLTNAFKISVTKGEASIITAQQTSKIQAGKSVRLVYTSSQDKSSFMESIPSKVVLIKEKKFLIELPKTKEMKVKQENITFSGVWDGEFSVWGNGNILQSDGAGHFSHTFQLAPGLNVITLQVSDPDKKNVEYFIYKIIRELSP